MTRPDLAGPAEPSREDLELEADLVRARLLHALDLLDRRRHELTDLPLQIRRHPWFFGTATGLLAVAVGGAIAAAIVRRRGRDKQAGRNRLGALPRPRRRAEVVAHAGHSNAIAEVFRRVFVGATIFLGVHLAKRSIRRKLNQPRRRDMPSSRWPWRATVGRSWLSGRS